MISQITSRTFVHVDDVLCSHSSIFIGGIAIKIIQSFTTILYNFKISGRYNKLSRELSQTPWFINGEKKVETSVQDLLCNPIAEAVKAECMF
jgi:tRNA pseudouridine synthase 10